jgi:hypothetical protein
MGFSAPDDSAKAPNAADSFQKHFAKCLEVAWIGEASAKSKKRPGGRFLKYRPLIQTGAGEAIRTPDPNLGKVMLYP